MAKQLVWFVTGTSSGFGAEFVEQILARGDKVIATARNVDKIEHLKAQGADVLQLDITASQEVMDDKAAEALRLHGRIDVLIHSAGYIQFGSWEDVE
jgi:NADP-dependent 3-hydroxy acid dehydrogenase YdfG